MRSKVWEVVPDKGYKIVFCDDPLAISQRSIATVTSTRLVLRHKWALHSIRIGLCHHR